MKYLVVIDARSPVGGLLVSMRGKIGGASANMEVGGLAHPIIVCRDLDWSKLPAFVGMVHLQNPDAPDEQPRDFVVPAAAILATFEAGKPASQPPPEQQAPPGSLH